MVYLRRLGILMVFSFIILKGSAQVFNPIQKKLYKTISDTIVLDSLSLVPGSVSFKTFPDGDSLNFPKANFKLIKHTII